MIAADTIIETSNGPVTLAAVRIGDMVLGEDWNWHQVISKELWSDPARSQDGFFRLETADGKWIVISGDHWIERKSPLLHILDSESTFDAHRGCDCAVFGELGVEGTHGYMANGFFVASAVESDGATNGKAQEHAIENSETA